MFAKNRPLIFCKVRHHTLQLPSSWHLVICYFQRFIHIERHDNNGQEKGSKFWGICIMYKKCLIFSTFFPSGIIFTSKKLLLRFIWFSVFIGNHQTWGTERECAKEQSADKRYCWNLVFIWGKVSQIGANYFTSL